MSRLQPDRHEPRKVCGPLPGPAAIPACVPTPLYDPRDERDACGFGLIAQLDDKPSCALVDRSIEALVLAKPMTTSQDFANWVCGDDLDPEFLMHALIRSHRELRGIATGATHKTIYMPALKSFHLCLPDRPTQERIVARLKQQLETVEGLRRSAADRLADLNRLPARLLAEVFDSAA